LNFHQSNRIVHLCLLSKSRRRLIYWAQGKHGTSSIYLDDELRIEKAYFYRNWLSVVASDHLPLVAEVAFRRHR